MINCGRRGITGDTALRLSHFFGTSPEFWLNLQGLYDLRLAQEKAGRRSIVYPRLGRSNVRRHRPLEVRAILEARIGPPLPARRLDIGIGQPIFRSPKEIS